MSPPSSIQRLRALLGACLLPVLISTSACGESEIEVKRMGKHFNAYVAALPDLKPLPTNRTYTLLVDYIQDASLPTLSAAEREQLFRRTEKYTLQYLGYRIKLKQRRKVDIEAFFREKAADFRHPVLSYPIRAWYLDPLDPLLNQKLRPVVAHAIRDKSPKLLARYFGKPGADEGTYRRRIIGQFELKLFGIYLERNAAGKRLLSPWTPAGSPRKLFVSFAHWDTIAFQEKATDLLMTNSIMAGPDTGMPIYVINRGGVTSAFIENNGYRPLHGVGVIGLYPFLSNGPFFKRERGAMTGEQSMDAMAMMLVHEFGHLLMRKKEAYDIEDSIHVAPRGLDYASWVRRIKAADDAKSKLVPTLKKF